MKKVKSKFKIKSVWKNAGRAKKRVLIAKDVLEQIKLRVIIPSKGDYLRLPYSVRKRTGEQLCDLEVKDCDACAMGGMFMGLIRMENNLKVNGSIRHACNADMISFMSPKLEKYFSEGQLSEIEAAFESNDAGKYGRYGSYKAQDFSNSKNDKFRLKRIMQNIIDNKGTFKP